MAPSYMVVTHHVPLSSTLSVPACVRRGRFVLCVEKMEYDHTKRSYFSMIRSTDSPPTTRREPVLLLCRARLGRHLTIGSGEPYTANQASTCTRPSHTHTLHTPHVSISDPFFAFPLLLPSHLSLCPRVCTCRANTGWNNMEQHGRGGSDGPGLRPAERIGSPKL
jgi:hypothetical protein